MGVHGLWRLLDTFGEVTQPGDWRGKRVAIDASIWITQFRAQCAAGENVEQRILEGFLLRILKLLFYGIEPIFVFDGIATSSKSAEHQRRAQRRGALERAALSRRARQIVAAQLAAGVLDVHALQRRSPAKARMLSPSPQRMIGGWDVPRLPLNRSSVVVSGSSSSSSNSSIGCDGGPHKVSRKRRRNMRLKPDVISRDVTNSFLCEAEEWIEQRKRGEMCLNSNALGYSSTSLFMGPRRVVEGPIGALAANGALTGGVANPALPTALSSGGTTESSVIIDDDDNNGDNNAASDDSEGHETVSSGTGTEDSVIVVSGDVETFVSHLRDLEKDVSNSSNSSCTESSSGSDDVMSDDSPFCSGSDTSNSDGSDKSKGSTTLWNPGTQLVGLTSPEGKATDHKVPEWSDEPQTVVPFHSVSYEANEVTDAVRPTEAASVPEAPPRRWYSSKAKQTIPFNLLEIVELLDCCGIPFVLSPNEADAQCAFLSQKRLVDAVFTEDSDVIVHGAAVVLRGFFAKGRHVVAYHQSDLLASGVDKNVLVALALLLGCDYAEGINGLSLLDALHVIAAVWTNPQGGSDGATHVLGMLRRWRSAVTQRCLLWDDGSTLLEFYGRLAKWSTLRMDSGFPQAHAVDAFFNAPIDTDVAPFTPASPDWRRLRSFASVQGLLGSALCRQRLDLAQKEYMSRQAHLHNGVEDQQQRKLTEFVVQPQRDERRVFKKQPPRYAAVLSTLRDVREGRCA
ncbi:putative DNA repair protein RAD2 [Trypanosoma grayi]|uniref:putative DNA repair protein RAD2 n=1 Tax=Trypanosoma grayi TaxID=71804 RepID=UPI0004F45B8E|nr:putative DNA repair protein RAD2 [Trypanosoma grayi]KEG15039.1 putative DNA repair protein RAD2 [Trypanosoma grayi]